MVYLGSGTPGLVSDVERAEMSAAFQPDLSEVAVELAQSHFGGQLQVHPIQRQFVTLDDQVQDTTAGKLLLAFAVLEPLLALHYVTVSEKVALENVSGNYSSSFALTRSVICLTKRASR